MTKREFSRERQKKRRLTKHIRSLALVYAINAVRRVALYFRNERKTRGKRLFWKSFVEYFENYLLKTSKNCRFYYVRRYVYARIISRRHVFTLWSSYYVIIIIIIVHAGAAVATKNVRFHCSRHRRGVASNKR